MIQPDDGFGLPLEEARQAVMSLRNLLEPTSTPISVEHRTVQATQAVGIQEVVDLSDLLIWYHGALGELYATVAVQGLQPSGPSGALSRSRSGARCPTRGCVGLGATCGMGNVAELGAASWAVWTMGGDSGTLPCAGVLSASTKSLPRR